MKRKTISKLLFCCAGIFLLLAIILGVVGFHKILVYYNSENYPILNKNAYVGGDAYNYIINGTYFTGYCVLSGTMLICANISAVAGLIFFFQTKQQQQDEIEETAEWNRLGQEEAAEEAAKQTRITSYWAEHSEEKAALLKKRADAESRLKEVGGLAIEQRRTLQKLINSIDTELSKDRRG